MGINLTKYRTLSFGLAGLLGVGGALYAHYNQVVSNEGFGIDRSIIFLAMIIIGGLGSIMGTLMGTAFMVLLPNRWNGSATRCAAARSIQFLGLKNNIAFLREMAIGHHHRLLALNRTDRASMARRSRLTGNFYPVLALRSERDGQQKTSRRPRIMSMTMKILLSTASLACCWGAPQPSPQGPISLWASRRLFAPRPRRRNAVRTGVADTYAWINKNGGINGAQVNVDTVDYGYQVPRAIAQYKKWSGADKVAAILGWGTADTEALTGFSPRTRSRYFGILCRGTFDPTGAGGKAKPAPWANSSMGSSYSTPFAAC